MRNVAKHFRRQSTHNFETYVQPTVKEVRNIVPSTDASEKHGTAGNQPQQESSIAQPEPIEPAALTSSIGKDDFEVQNKSFPSADGTTKVSREIKILKDTQSQSKVLAGYLDDASQQGKLRKRRSDSASPACTSAPKQVSPAAAPAVAHRKRLQSRCSVAEDDPSTVGVTNRRTGMRSDNEEFKLKHQRFLHNLHDKGAEAMDDSVGEDTSHDQPTTANDSLSSFGSDGIMSIKPLDESFGPIAEPPKPGYDRFCFRCKQSKGESLVGCNSCIRSFHQGCTRPMYNDDNWTCQECKSSSLAHETNPFPTEGYVNLHDCLQYVLEMLLCNHEANRLFNPLDKAAIKSYERVTHHMDLVEISNKLKAKQYSTTEEFLADLNWIVHNITICSDNSKTLSVAKVLYKVGRLQIVNMETCRECYMNVHRKQATWFKEACKNPHLLVWAKLKGFPHWPGKLMSVNANNQADIRFFGEHDRAWVSVKDCYLFSKESPNPQKSAKKQQLSESLFEAGEHIENLIKRFGSFNYAPYRTPLDPTRIDDHLKEMVPNAFEENRSNAPMIKIKIVNNHGKMTAHTSKGSIGESPSSTGTVSMDISSSTDSANKPNQKRVTRRASKAAMLNDDEAKVVPETESDVKVAKKRKSVCFQKPSPSESESVGKLVIHRNSGNWATENISKRRKSVMVSPAENKSKAKNSSDANGTDSNVNIAEVTDNQTPPEQDDNRLNESPLPRKNNEQLEANVSKEIPPTATTTRNKACNPSPDSSNAEVVPCVPIPIKVEKLDDEYEKASLSGGSPESISAATVQQTHERGRPAPVSENISKNQKARKSFPGVARNSVGPVSIGKSSTMMTIVPKASVPESNSPIILVPNITAEAVRLTNNCTASSNGTVGNKEASKIPVSTSCTVVPASSTNIQLPSSKQKTTVVRASMVLLPNLEKSIDTQSPPTGLQSVPSNNQQPRLASVSVAATQPAKQQFAVLQSEVLSKQHPMAAPVSIPTTGASVKEPTQTLIQQSVSSSSKQHLGVAPASAAIPGLRHQELPLNVQNIANYKQPFRMSPVSVPASGVPSVTTELAPATSAPQQSTVSTGSVNSPRLMLRNCGTVNNSNACSSLPEDQDVIVIDEGSPEPSPAAVRSNMKRKGSQRNCTLPPLQPKPSGSQEGELESNLSFTELLDNYASQVAEKSRGLLEHTLRQLADDGLLKAKVVQLTLELEQTRQQHSLTIERLKKEHKDQIETLRLDKIRSVAKAKKAMWCRSCHLEANFYCCWNTAYCSDKCQMDHWPQHEPACEQMKKGTKINTVPRSPEGSGSFVSPYPSSSKAKVQVRQRMPASSPTTIKTTPGVHQDQHFSHSGSMRMAPNSSMVARPGANNVAGGSNIYTTPRIHSVQSHATGFDSHPYSNNVNGGGSAKPSATTGSSQTQRKQLQTSPTSIATRDTPAGEFSTEVPCVYIP
ncbi:MYND-type zinc finger-containing chromatin reader Zmynd8 [Anopheles ziemanni]|uniref:MYND-type zinc finger-containing chromatin reader Zmynd8 n=1 Tax=Anopheles ziemanni TaxID=345580 RepID=UPI00265E4532|nr:MYND-type zinc finger-containing chromatin reader Zmynd8 [Anopheles ziemanni]